MPEKSTVERAKKDLREGKSPTTAAGEFVHEEIEHVRRGKHGARSAKQAIAIGLSKARRAGVPLPPPAPGQAKEETRESAERDYRKGQTAPGKKPSARRSRAREEALKREPKSTVSHAALSKQARTAQNDGSFGSFHAQAQGRVEQSSRGTLSPKLLPQCGKNATKAANRPLVANRELKWGGVLAEREGA